MPVVLAALGVAPVAEAGVLSTLGKWAGKTLSGIFDEGAYKATRIIESRELPPEPRYAGPDAPYWDRRLTSPSADDAGRLDGVFLRPANKGSPFDMFMWRDAPPLQESSLSRMHEVDPAMTIIIEEESAAARFARLQIDPDGPYGRALMQSCQRGELKQAVRSHVEQVEARMDAFDNDALAQFELTELADRAVNAAIKGVTSLVPYATQVLAVIPVEVSVAGAELEIDISLPCGSSLSFGGKTQVIVAGNSLLREIP